MIHFFTQFFSAPLNLRMVREEIRFNFIFERDCFVQKESGHFYSMRPSMIFCMLRPKKAFRTAPKSRVIALLKE